MMFQKGNKYVFEKIPENIAKLLKDHMNRLDDNPSVRHEAIKEILYPRQHIATDLFDFGLKAEWEGYKRIRFFSVETGSEIHVFLQKRDSNYDYFSVTESKEAERIHNELCEHTTSRFANWNEQDEVFDNNIWDNLDIYGDGEVEEESDDDVFNCYKIQNASTAKVLFQYIRKHSSASRNITIIDLGCGTGNVYKNFSAIEENLVANGSFQWIGVDYNAPNISEAESISEEQGERNRAIWVRADALDFVRNPEAYLKSQQSAALASSEIYVVSSGLLTQNVLPLDKSLAIVEELRKYQNLKLLAITGLHTLHISPYIAKQLGFKPVEIHPETTDLNFSMRLYGYTAVSDVELIKRIEKKASQYNILDISFVNHVELLNKIERSLIQRLDMVFLSGVTLSDAYMCILEEWAVMNPRLCFIVSSLNDNALENNYKLVEKSLNRFKFLCFDQMKYSPRFSPHFTRKISSISSNDIAMYSGKRWIDSILARMLFQALNSDFLFDTDSRKQAKNLIYQILNRRYAEKRTVKDISSLLQNVISSGISFDSPLYRTFEAYLYLYDIKLNTNKGKEIADDFLEKGIITRGEWKNILYDMYCDRKTLNPKSRNFHVVDNTMQQFQEQSDDILNEMLHGVDNSLTSTDNITEKVCLSMWACVNLDEESTPVSNKKLKLG